MFDIEKDIAELLEDCEYDKRNNPDDKIPTPISIDKLKRVLATINGCVSDIPDGIKRAIFPTEEGGANCSIQTAEHVRISIDICPKGEWMDILILGDKSYKKKSNHSANNMRVIRDICEKLITTKGG